METAIQNLELLLTRAEHDVDNLSSKLDQEFAALSTENEARSDVKLSEIMKNIRNLRSELKRVTLDIEEFQKSQQSVMAEVKDRLANVFDQFEELGSVNIAAGKTAEGC